MCEGNLNFQILLDNKDLVAEKVLECIDKNFSIEEQEKIYVAEIDTKYIDGIGLCNHYNIPRKQGANCLIVECIRKDIKKYKKHLEDIISALEAKALWVDWLSTATFMDA